MNLPNKLFVKQIVEEIEIFTNFETKNKYSIQDESGKEIYYAYEESGLMSRLFIARMRPLDMNIIDKDKKKILSIKRPFAFFYPKHIVSDSNGAELGIIKKRFAFVNRKMTFEYNGKKVVCVAKFPHFWTFKIYVDKVETGKILKKWSGFGKEAFTDADNFAVEFGNADNNLKKMILALAFAIDLSYFEKGGRR